MNIALFMLPKSMAAYLYDDYTVRQALEKMAYHGYAAIPVIDREGYYVGTVSEGSFLWYLVNGEGGELHPIDISSLENVMLKDVPYDKRNTTVNISASIEEIYDKVLNQNFIPVVDDRQAFIGIITRSAVIQHLREKSGIDEQD
ncbi:MAG: CBS domain-containing protein [Clostridia bacterium]|nr:CBS domain-containing protein [Clostridia bacterium]